MRVPKLRRLSVLKRGLSRRPLFGNALTAATAISFSLTFVVAIVALLLGIIPERSLNIGFGIDTGVLLLFVPLCALVFAILVEVLRTMIGGGFKPDKPPAPNPLSAWRPGHGEG